MDRIRQNTIRDSKNLNVCTWVQIPVASTARDLSSPFAISSRVAKTAPNALQTASTAEYLQDQQVSESLQLSLLLMWMQFGLLPEENGMCNTS